MLGMTRVPIVEKWNFACDMILPTYISTTTRTVIGKRYLLHVARDTMVSVTSAECRHILHVQYSMQKVWDLHTGYPYHFTVLYRRYWRPSLHLSTSNKRRYAFYRHRLWSFPQPLRSRLLPDLKILTQATLYTATLPRRRPTPPSMPHGDALHRHTAPHSHFSLSPSRGTTTRWRSIPPSSSFPPQPLAQSEQPLANARTPTITRAGRLATTPSSNPSRNSPRSPTYHEWTSPPLPAPTRIYGYKPHNMDHCHRRNSLSRKSITVLYHRTTNSRSGTPPNRSPSEESES